MSETQKRDPSLDLVRCCALFSVILVHFFLNGGYYELVVEGPVMFTMTTIRSGAMVCVPLFLMLTGYLMCEKKLSLRYFTKIKKTLIIYILASVFCGICYYLYKCFIEHEAISPISLVAGIFAYSTAPYAWYIEMYIGLFCLVPFLNILYQGLSAKKEKQWLIAVLLMCTALPGVINIYRFSDLHWWMLPSSSDAYHKLIPSWWSNLYPITYYFLGCYLREFPLQMNTGKKTAYYAASLVIAGIFNYYRSAGSTFLWGAWQSYGSFINVVQTVLLFDLLANLDLSHLGEKSKQWLARLSDWALGAYLVSWVFDKVFYKLLEAICPNVQRRFLSLPIIVPVIFACSVCTSAVLNWMYLYCNRLISKLFGSKESCAHS